MESKNIRYQILRQRDAVSVSRRILDSELIMERILSLTELEKAETIFIYMNFRSEVVTSFCIQKMLELKKKIVLPVTLSEKKELLPVFITDIKKDLAPGYATIPEPVQSIRKSQLVLPESIDIIFLPGSVFDERGGRMGYGGGFYDRFVSQKAPQALRVGLAFEMQMVKEVPLQIHDELVDLIITEKRIVYGSRQKKEIVKSREKSSIKAMQNTTNPLA